MLHVKKYVNNCHLLVEGKLQVYMWRNGEWNLPCTNIQKNASIMKEYHLLQDLLSHF